MPKISWIGLLRTAPGLKSAVEKMTKTPGALESDQNWYNVITALLSFLAVCGVVATDILKPEEIKTISALAAVGIPAILTIIDRVAQLWLRTRKPDAKEILAKRAEEGK